jgi:hypothetical protein
MICCNVNKKINGYMCELFSIGVKNEPAIKFVTDFWDNPRIFKTFMGFQNVITMITLMKFCCRYMISEYAFNRVLFFIFIFIHLARYNRNICLFFPIEYSALVLLKPKLWFNYINMSSKCIEPFYFVLIVFPFRFFFSKCLCYTLLEPCTKPNVFPIHLNIIMTISNYLISCLSILISDFNYKCKWIKNPNSLYF